MSLGYGLALGITGILGTVYATFSIEGFIKDMKKFIFTSENNIFNMLFEVLNIYFWAAFICKHLLKNNNLSYGTCQIIGIVIVVDFIRISIKKDLFKNELSLISVILLTIPYIFAIFSINL